MDYENAGRLSSLIADNQTDSVTDRQTTESRKEQTEAKTEIPGGDSLGVESPDLAHRR